MPDDVDRGYREKELPALPPREPEAVYARCSVLCDGVTGDDVDPEYYCRAGEPWLAHDEIR